jgi:hypothetical protein
MGTYLYEAQGLGQPRKIVSLSSSAADAGIREDTVDLSGMQNRSFGPCLASEGMYTWFWQVQSLRS